MFEPAQQQLIGARHWLVTGAAGFIGSHLVEHLLRFGARVTGIDNFSTGRGSNLTAVQASVGAAWSNFRFIEGDLRDLRICRLGLREVDVVLHQAALGSVPRSVANPLASLSANVDGFAALLQIAREQNVRRIVYASSSSVYGDNPAEFKSEQLPIAPRSPYAVSKAAKEQLAAALAPLYGMTLVGLRYFNVFGARQDPNGAYAAVIPRWEATMRRGEVCEIYGDGSTSRDFCFVDNVVQANLRAGIVELPSPSATVLNVAVGMEMSLNELQAVMSQELVSTGAVSKVSEPRFRPFREGDVKRSRADISLATKILGYNPTVTAREGLRRLLRG
jgi:UDP-N-acetylglucosamine 4-epimerase